jgi:ubiquitin carboxyl-terminal hydrolase 7
MMPSDSSTDKLKTALALQKLFVAMQEAKAPPSTAGLTAAFGWTSADAFQQHDVQEFSRILCDALVRSRTCYHPFTPQRSYVIVYCAWGA